MIFLSQIYILEGMDLYIIPSLSAHYNSLLAWSTFATSYA